MAFIPHLSSRFLAGVVAALCITAIGCGVDPGAEGTAVSSEAIEAFVNANPKYAEEASTMNSVSMPNEQSPGQPKDAASASTLSVEN